MATISCIWCGSNVVPHQASLQQVSFRGSSFSACSEPCYQRAVRYLATHEYLRKPWGWVFIPLLILYGFVTISLMIRGLVSDHLVRLFGVVVLSLGGAHLLIFPDLPKLTRPIPPRWRNIRSMVRFRAFLGVLALLLAVIHYYFR